MSKYIRVNRLDTQYQDLLIDIMEKGHVKGDRTGVGTMSVFGRQIRHNMSDGFPVLTSKRMYFKGIITELLWFLRGDTHIKFLLDHNCNIWTGDAFKNHQRRHPETILTIAQFAEVIRVSLDSGEWGDLGPIYGDQWRNLDGVDQIANLIHDLKNNPDSRRIMVNAWNVERIKHMVLPPCHYGFQVWTRELTLSERKKLCKVDPETECKNDAEIELHLALQNIPQREISLIWNQRSVDTFLGLPFNIASYGLLLELLAIECNMVPGELIGNLGDTHLYTNHLDQAREQLGRSSYALPRLKINTEFWNPENALADDGVALLKNVMNDDWCASAINDDITLANYDCHPAISAPLNN